MNSYFHNNSQIIFLTIKTIFNIIFNIFAKAVAIIGVLVSLVDLRQLDKIKDKEIFLWTIHNYNSLKEVKNNYNNIDNYYLIIDKKE